MLKQKRYKHIPQPKLPSLENQKLELKIMLQNKQKIFKMHKIYLKEVNRRKILEECEVESKSYMRQTQKFKDKYIKHMCHIAS